MAIDSAIEGPATRFTGGWWIATIALRVTTIIILIISLIIIFINVLKVPYGENQVEIVHFYDNSGLFKFMFSIIVLVMGYLVLQIVIAIHFKKQNRDPNLTRVFYGEWLSWILLCLCGLEGISSTIRSYKWLHEWFQDDEAASQYDYFFDISYALSAMLFIASFCTFTSSILISCVRANRSNWIVTLGAASEKNLAKVQPAAIV